MNRITKFEWVMIVLMLVVTFLITMTVAYAIGVLLGGAK